MADKEAKGRFECSLEGYGGFFELPYPFLDRHMRTWWKVAMEDDEREGAYAYSTHDREWLASVELIERFGKWAVDGVPVGDLKSDGVPMAVKVWVTKEVDGYVFPFLMPSMLRLLVASTSTG